MAKSALITGITGQDGSYLAELLLEKGYTVFGLMRRSSSPNTKRIDHIFDKLKLSYGDLTDAGALSHVIAANRPDEIYNLGAMSHVAVSFEVSEYAGECDGLGFLKLLNAVRAVGGDYNPKIYQASTSELYGDTPSPQSETTPFKPRSPYACAKLYAFTIGVNYRESYNMFVSNGILFNHESPRRGINFVTRKICRGAARIAAGLDTELRLGNLNSKRDWGHARDYVEGMWRILQADKADDFVLSTGGQITVRDWVNMSFNAVGLPLTWEGQGVDEVGSDEKGRKLVVVDPRYFRPAEVEDLMGDRSKAEKLLGWKPTTSTEDLCKEMVAAEQERATKGDPY